MAAFCTRIYLPYLLSRGILIQCCARKSRMRVYREKFSTCMCSKYSVSNMKDLVIEFDCLTGVIGVVCICSVCISYCLH
jgi:hypothetical protein